jgi:hypothetical protein
MTHPIRRVVTGSRREGPRGRHLRWSGPVRARQQARTGLFSVDIWRARATPARIVANLHPRNRGGPVPGRGAAGIVVRAADRRSSGVSQGMTPSQLFQFSSIAALLACASFDSVANLTAHSSQ